MKVAASKSTARQVRERVLGSENRFWTISDFGESTPAVHMELHRLKAAGELRQVRRGVYWRGRPTRFGMAPPTQVDAVRAELGDSEAVGAAGWYATNLLGLSTQVSPVEVLAVTRRPPTGFERVRFVDRSRRTGRRDQGLNDFEVTLFEALEAWDQHVEHPPREATQRFLDLLAGDGVRLDRVVPASRTEPAIVRERLRELLRRLDRDDLANAVPRARSQKARQRALAVVEEDR
jgi:hypothetical protein